METVPQLDQLLADIQLNKLVSGIQSKLNEALHSLTRREVNLNLKTSGLMPITEAQKLVQNISGQATTVYIPIMGDVVGDIFVFYLALFAIT